MNAIVSIILNALNVQATLAGIRVTLVAAGVVLGALAALVNGVAIPLADGQNVDWSAAGALVAAIVAAITGKAFSKNK